MPFQKTAYKKSKTLYALAPESFDNGTVDAVWTVTKSGKTTITWGSVTVYGAADYKDLLELYQTTSGGYAQAKWDGEYMATVYPTPLAEMNELADDLDPMLNDLPNVPEGYDGWYIGVRK